MGLLIDDTNEIKSLIDDISKICEINILDYEVTDRLLDGTVFYVTFANELRSLLNLTQEDTNNLLIYTNELMQLLDEQNKPVLQTFDYIRKFAKIVVDNKGNNFNPIFTKHVLREDLNLYVIEPPCGSNICILESNNQYLVIDGGFKCYEEEMVKLLKAHFPNFFASKPIGLITHADMDHMGIMNLMHKIYMSKNCYDNFVLETNNEKDFRAQNPLHEPYCAISGIISKYETPELSKCNIIGEKKDDQMLSKIGTIKFANYTFTIFEGRGGHIKGEVIIKSDELKLIFTGDIFVNIKGYSKEQKAFNQLAPFLMTGVDSNPQECKKCREFLVSQFKGYTFVPGHGGIIHNI